MKRRNILAMFLALVMCFTLLAGCGGNKEANSNSETKQTEAAPAADTKAAEDSGTEDEDDEEIVEINVIYTPLGNIPADCQIVEDAVNEITEKEIKVHVNIDVMEVGSYDQQIGLMMSSGETVDLLRTLPFGASLYNNMLSQKQLYDITDELNEYGQGILDVMGSLISTTTVDGRVYGVPVYISLVRGAYIVMRTDVLEDLGLLEKAQNMTSFTEYEEILAAVKASDKWNYLAGISNSDANGLCLPIAGSYMGVDNFSDAYYYDQLGDLNKIVAIDPAGTDDTVKMNYATDEYKAMIEKMRDWYEKGYVYKDAATTEDSGETLVKNNVAFSYFSEGELGIEAGKASACGMPMTCVKVVDLPVSTSSCTKFVWGVPATCSEPAAAVKFLNMMYTDARIENLLCYGIENVHYEIKDGVAQFLEGQDINSCGYYMGDFLFGNQMLAYPWSGQSADFREIVAAEMEKVVKSKYLGFTCDTSNIQNEISAISNVIAEFGPSLESGIAEEGTYEAFLEKLNASGADIIIEEYQKQLDAWLANQ